MLYQLIAAIFLAFLVAYFFEVWSLVRALKANGKWSEIGSPDLFSPIGQSRFFAMVFGKDQVAYGQLGVDLKKKSKRIRIYMIFGVLCFAVLVLLLVGAI